MAHRPPDPRTIITPDAFEVEPGLIGLPLATPFRRGIASLVDLAVIGTITVVTKDVGAVVGLLVAAVFVYMALKSPITRDLPAPLAWAFRFSVGCLGFVVLVISVTAIWWIRAGPDLDDLIEDATVSVDGGELGVRDVLAGVQGGIALQQASSGDAALAAAAEIARTGFASGLSESEIRQVLLELVPEEAAWAEQADSLFERALATGRRPTADEGPAAPAANPPEAALAAFALLLQDSAAADTVDAAERDELRRRALPAIAADTLERLHARLRSLEAEQARVTRALEASRSRVEDLEAGSGLVRLIRELVDQLGLAFGWGSIYFAVLLPWWKGQTLGKRLLGVRVLRLDGEPITWWLAFERAGGYAAGVATGLLGFAQVYWDPNRQGIHDKIAGTVVVRTGAAPVPGAGRAATTSGRGTPPPPDQR